MSPFNQNANGIEVKLSMVVLQRKRGAGNGQYYWTHLTSKHDTLTKTYSYNHSLSDKYVLIYYTSKELFIDFYPIYHHCCRQKKRVKSYEEDYIGRMLTIYVKKMNFIVQEWWGENTGVLESWTSPADSFCNQGKGEGVTLSFQLPAFLQPTCTNSSIQNAMRNGLPMSKSYVKVYGYMYKILRYSQ